MYSGLYFILPHDEDHKQASPLTVGLHGNLGCGDILVWNSGKFQLKSVWEQSDLFHFISSPWPTLFFIKY